jgi:X-Pro dipeptidyl-peptidase
MERWIGSLSSACSPFSVPPCWRHQPRPHEGIRTLTTQSCSGSSSSTDDACYADTAKVITWKLRPIDQVIPAGLRLGLVLTLSDAEFVSSHSTGATVTIDLAGSRLQRPVAPGAGLVAPSLSPRTAAPVVVDGDSSTTADSRFQ